MKRALVIFANYVVLSCVIFPVSLFISFIHQSFPQTPIEWSFYFLLPIPLLLLWCRYFDEYQEWWWTKKVDKLGERVNSSPLRLVLVLAGFLVAIALALGFQHVMEGI